MNRSKTIEKIYQLIELTTSPYEEEARSSALLACKLIKENGFKITDPLPDDFLIKLEDIINDPEFSVLKNKFQKAKAQAQQKKARDLNWEYRQNQKAKNENKNKF